MGENGIDPRLENVAARPFQETRIALLAENRLVDLAGPLLFDDVGFHELVSDPHPKAADRGISRQREVEDAFEPLAGVVDERLLDRRAGDLVADFDRNLVIADGERDFAAVDIGHQRAERFADGVPLVAGEPGRRPVACHQSFVTCTHKDDATHVKGRSVRTAEFDNAAEVV
jgi:hypothetical protein